MINTTGDINNSHNYDQHKGRSNRRNERNESSPWHKPKEITYTRSSYNLWRHFSFEQWTQIIIPDKRFQYRRLSLGLTGTDLKPSPPSSSNNVLA